MITPITPNYRYKEEDKHSHTLANVHKRQAARVAMCERFTAGKKTPGGAGPGQPVQYCFPSLKTKLAFFISRVTTE